MIRTAWWHRRLYPDGYDPDLLGELIQRVERHLKPEHAVLDIGAGAGERNRYSLRGRCREVVGVDVDPRVAANPLLDRGVCAEVTRLPFPDESFDIAFAIYVLEHVAEPNQFVPEVWRVLKPGGVFLSLTPNRWHYVAIAASLTPTSFHKWYNRKRGRGYEDTFPTVYRLNSRREQREIFAQHGFATEEVRAFEIQPKYLMFSLPTFLVGAAYERLVNATPSLEGLRVNLLSTFRKLGDGRQQQGVL